MSRPRLKPSGGGAKALMAIALTGPYRVLSVKRCPNRWCKQADGNIAYYDDPEMHWIDTKTLDGRQEQWRTVKWIAGTGSSPRVAPQSGPP
jgi:hypothetical protein